MLRAKHARRYRLGIVDGNWRCLLCVGANGGDDLKNVSSRIVDENGSVRCTDSFRDFGENCRRIFFERNRAPENFPDRVEEIDLLVTLGELDRGLFYLLRSAKNLGDDRKKQPKVHLIWRIISLAWS